MPNPPGDGDAMSSTLPKVIGGNGQCHCIHVDALIKQVAAIEEQLKTGGSSRLRADAPAYGGRTRLRRPILGEAIAQTELEEQMREGQAVTAVHLAIPRGNSPCL